MRLDRPVASIYMYDTQQTKRQTRSDVSFADSYNSHALFFQLLSQSFDAELLIFKMDLRSWKPSIGNKLNIKVHHVRIASQCQIVKYVTSNSDFIFNNVDRRPIIF